MAGLDLQGFNAKSLDDIRTEQVDSVHAGISPELDTSSRSPVGEVLDADGSQKRQLWEVLQELFASFDIDQASGAALAARCALLGTLKYPATRSTDSLSLDLDAGVYAAQSLVVHVVGDPETRFRNRAEVTSIGGATTVLMESEELGPVRANAGTLTAHVSVTGLNSVLSDPAEATLGAAEENDAQLRARTVRERAKKGSTAAAAIKADLEDKTVYPLTDTVRVRPNDTDATVAGVAPHAIGVFILSGHTDAEIATAIMKAKAGGIGTSGSTTATAYDTQGIPHTISFTRITQQNVYVEVDLTVIQGQYAGTQAVSDAILPLKVGPVGQDLIRSQLVKAVLGVAGVWDVPALRLGFAPSPVGEANLAIDENRYHVIVMLSLVINVTTIPAPP